MSEVARLLRIGHVDDRRAVLFVRACQRVSLHAAVMADVGDPAVPLAVNRGLVGAARLKVVVTDERHVALFRVVLCDNRGNENEPESSATNGPPCLMGVVLRLFGLAGGLRSSFCQRSCSSWLDRVSVPVSALPPRPFGVFTARERGSESNLLDLDGTVTQGRHEHTTRSVFCRPQDGLMDACTWNRLSCLTVVERCDRRRLSPAGESRAQAASEGWRTARRS